MCLEIGENQERLRKSFKRLTERINNMSLAKDITSALINDNCIKGITPTEKFEYPSDVQESIERVLESRKIMVNIK